MGASAATDVDAKLHGQRRQPALQRPDDAGRDPRRMPVHPHDGAERLEPKGVREAMNEFVAPVVMDDGLAHDRAKASHPVAKPFGHTAAVKRKVSASRTL